MRGSFNTGHQEILAPLVSGRVVHDLGAGDLTLAHDLVGLRASKVIAVDKERMPSPESDKVECIQSYFKAYKGKPDIVLLSWPVNWDSDVLHLIEMARVIIYVGRNTNGVACGYAALWRYLETREVLHYDDQDQRSTLIVYGPGRRAGGRLPEEHAAIDQSRVWAMSEVEFDRDRFQRLQAIVDAENHWQLAKAMWHAFPIRDLITLPWPLLVWAVRDRCSW